MPNNLPKSKWIISIPMAILLLAILVALYFTQCPKPVYIPPDNHKTDTVIITKYKPITVFEYVPVPGKTVIKYLDKPGMPANTKIIYQDTGSIRIVYGDTITKYVDPAFLANYPDNPKLLGLSLSDKYLTLNTYYPSDSISGNEYYINTQKYTYVWQDNKLLSKPIKTKPKILGSSFASATYNPFIKSYKLDLDYTLSFQRVGLTARTFLQTGGRPLAGVEAGLKFQIK